MSTAKFLPSFCVAIFVCLGSTARAQISVQENWSGSTLDTNNWTATLPFADSAYSVNNGSITLSNRATLLSVDSFFSPIVITGTISLSASDISRIATRTSGEVQAGNIYKELNGLWFTFTRGDAIAGGGFSIEYASNTGNQLVAYTPYNVDPGLIYDFQITDDGTNASMLINGTELTQSAIDPLFSEGNQVAIYSRGTLFFAGPHSSTLGPIEITAVPEPSTAAMVGFSGFVLLLALLRKKLSAS